MKWIGSALKVYLDYRPGYIVQGLILAARHPLPQIPEIDLLHLFLALYQVFLEYLTQVLVVSEDVIEGM